MGCLVSVIMMTYNHSRQISYAIEGVLEQDVDFDYELIVANDLSTDNTDEIVQRLMKSHAQGSKIKYLNRPVNLGPNQNFVEALEIAEGEYIAICEGDDFWTNPQKLKKQIEFLEANPDYSSSFHEVNVIYPDKVIPFSIDNSVPSNRTMTFRGFLEGGRLIPTCSFVFRKNKVLLPPFFREMKYGDFPLFCVILLNSQSYYFPENMATYRKDNLSSLTNSKKLFDPILIKTDYIQFFIWLANYANDNDKVIIQEKITEEINTIRNKIKMYTSSKTIRFRNFLENLISK